MRLITIKNIYVSNKREEKSISIIRNLAELMKLIIEWIIGNKTRVKKKIRVWSYSQG